MTTQGVMNSQLIYILISTIIFLHCEIGLGQSNEGKEFWFGFMHHRDEGFNNKVAMITSKYDTEGNISVDSRNYSQDFTVKANEVSIINLPGFTENQISETIQDIGIKLTSNDPVSVYIHQYYGYRSEATAVLPKESIGNEYYILTYQGVNNNNQNYPSQFQIIGTEDETIILIRPSALTQNQVEPGEVINITLNKGEAYQVQGASWREDLTGSYITSDKPIAVFAGARWTEVPNNCGLRDNLLEQMYSVNTWGKQFIGIPAQYVSYSKFRIIASEDNTTIKKYSQLNEETFSLNQGSFTEFNSSQPFYIEANKPIQVAQYLIGVNCSGYSKGDPSMLLLNSIEQTRDTVTLYNSRLQNITENFINIIMYTEDAEHITIDGVNLNDISTLNQIDANNLFSYVTLPVSTGAHTIISEGCGIIASAYGYGDAESYAYSGGASFRSINFNALPEGGCLNDTIIFDSKLSPQRFNFFWDLGDGNYSTESKFEHKYPSLGTYPLSVIITDKCLNKVDTFYRDIIITLRQAVLASDDVEVCENEPFRLGATDLDGATYEWTGPNEFFSEEQYVYIEQATLENTGIYEVIGIISGCATFPVPVNVIVNALPKAELGNDTFYCKRNDPLTITAQPSETYLWSTGETSQSIQVTQEGIYSIEVSDQNDCTNFDSLYVSEVCPTELIIPNIFSPNGDNINDVFKIIGNDVSKFTLHIWDRWGNLVFKSEKLTDYWNGKSNGSYVENGVYVYQIDLLGIAESGAPTPLSFRGDITILR